MDMLVGSGGGGGKQWLHHFLPPHTKRVSFVIIVLPVIVRCFS